MASPPLTERFCDPCKEDNKQIKARTLCYECHILLCEPCSDYHHRLKITKNHHLVELVHFMKNSFSKHRTELTGKSTSFNEDELASDFLEIVTLTNDTVLYHGAQVALESTSLRSKVDERWLLKYADPTHSKDAQYRESTFATSKKQKHATSRHDDLRRLETSKHVESTPITKPEKRTASNQADPTQMKAATCLEFTAKRPEDKEDVYVTGISCVSDNIIVVDNENSVMKLYDQNGRYLSSTELEVYTWGIKYVRSSKFATCGYGNIVYIWKIRRQTIVNKAVLYHMEQNAYGIHYNGTYFCLLHNANNTITVLDRQGRQVRKIAIKEACGKTFKFGWDIHMDSDTNNIHVPCEDTDGVLCMTSKGQALWFTPLTGTWGITEIQGTLCVADCYGDCLHLITKQGKHVGKLLDEMDLGGKPAFVCYGQNNKLYVSYISRDDEENIISVFLVTQ